MDCQHTAYPNRLGIDVEGVYPKAGWGDTPSRFDGGAFRLSFANEAVSAASDTVPRPCQFARGCPTHTADRSSASGGRRGSGRIDIRRSASRRSSPATVRCPTPPSTVRVCLSGPRPRYNASRYRGRPSVVKPIICAMHNGESAGRRVIRPDRLTFVGA